jgi:hypothetical protein
MASSFFLSLYLRGGSDVFEKIGRKLIRGAKAELTEDSGIDWGKVLDAAVKIAEAGLFLGIMLISGRSEKLIRTTTIVVNNYILKEER